MAGEVSFLWLLIAVGGILASARALGALCTRVNQPAVLGEIAAGVLLGPTVLGALAPSVSARLFPSAGVQAAALDGLIQVALILFVFAAGLEADLVAVWRQRRKVAAVAAAGLAAPIALGTATALVLPGLFHGSTLVNPWVSALTFGVALSITALPVVARTLQGLGLYGSGMGIVILASAALDDFGGWIGFAVLQALRDDAATGVLGIAPLIVKPVILAVLLLTAGRAMIHHAVPWFEAGNRRRRMVPPFLLATAIAAAAASDCLGIHAVFGAFLIGVAAASTPHLGGQIRRTLDHVVSAAFAPLFFASIGLRIDLVGHLDLLLLGTVLLVATVSKVVACTAAALWTGAGHRESFAIGFGMNARGAMEIVLSELALHQGLIHEALFVALVGMSLATSIMAGPSIRRILRLAIQHPAPAEGTDKDGDGQASG